MDRSCAASLANYEVVSSFLSSLEERIYSERKIDCEWQPLPGPQSAVFETDAFETLYGGAAGGGKTSCAVGLARLQGRHVLILRRTFSELEDSIIQEAYKWYGDPRHYNSTKHAWQWGQQRIRFGYAESLKHVFQYQSAQFDTLLVDELTQWDDPRIYEYLLSRVRTTDPQQRCRVVAFTNPGNVGGRWVVQRWRPWLDPNYPDPAEPGELRWFRRDDDGHDTECEPDHPDAVSRTYIPARLSDNPYLSDDYEKQLRALPEPWRSQLLDGDWSAGMEDDPWQLIPTAWIDAAMQRWTEPSGALDVLGVDVARGGDDNTVLAPRYGRTIGNLTVVPGKLTPDGPSVAELVVKAVTPQTAISLDIIGVGSSPYDILNDGYRVTPVNGSEKALDKYGEQCTDKSGRLRMRNVRAGMYWRLRELLEAGEIDLPDDTQLRAELVAVQWKITPSGVQIRSKDEIKAKIGCSPDRADAVAMATWIDNTPAPSPSEMMAF